jgi:hypothetical protein
MVSKALLYAKIAAMNLAAAALVIALLDGFFSLLPLLDRITVALH